MVGDDFLAETFRIDYKLHNKPYFLKSSFEVSAFCSNRFNGKNQNALSHLQISFAAAINSSNHLPSYFLVVIDDDLIRFLNYDNCGRATHYGEWLEWLVQEVGTMIQKNHKLLPAKAKACHLPIVYWVALP